MKISVKTLKGNHFDLDVSATDSVCLLSYYLNPVVAESRHFQCCRSRGEHLCACLENQMVIHPIVAFSVCRVASLMSETCAQFAVGSFC